ncbi:choice-of-anchor G family protein [Nesterenkonia halotolerans]|uniref:choice-of-anchor G family protein n=1 Tax=Nesterenkonia halotolerans TaxID=225325 RepID=UPI003EE642BB
MLASGLTMAAAVPAQAAPDDVSEGLGKFLGGQAAGVDLDSIAEVEGAYAENPSGVNPVDANPLSAEVLNSVGVNLNDSLQLFGPNGVISLGAVNQYGEALDDGDAGAASGAVSDQGGISVGGSEAFPANAEVNLTPLLTQVEADGLVDDLSLSLGAVSSSAEQLDGEAATTDYDVAGATLNFSSPAVSEVYDDLELVVGEAQTELDGLSDSLSGDLASIDLGSLAALDSSVTLDPLNLPDVLPAEVIGESAGVTVNLTNGQVTVDLATLLANNPDLPDLNDLDPNSRLLSAGVTAAIADGVTQAATDAVSGVVSGLDAAIAGTEVEVVADVDVLAAGGATVVVDADLGELLEGGSEATVDVDASGGLGGLLSFLGLEDVDALGDLVLETVVGTVGESLDEIIDAESTVDELTGSLATNVLGPVLGLVNEVVGVTVNVQPETGDLGAESSTVRALQISLLPGSELATVNLASSSVRGTDAEEPVFDPAIAADPTTVEQGESTEITGDGFAAEESVTVSIPGAEDGDDPITVETTTNADGEFTTDLPIPADYPTEDVVVTAVGAESETPATTSITVVGQGEGPGDGDDGDDGAFDTDIVAEPSNVEQGDSTEITGIGFASEETVTVSIPGAEDGDDPITVDTTTNSDGRFTVDLPVPADYPLGEVDVTAVGAESETPASTELNIVAPGDGGDDEGDFDTAVVVDPTTVEQGDSTEVTGIGFAPEETVTVSIPGAEDGDDPITVETTTDGDGGFTVDLPIPADYPTGDVVVTAVGDESDTPATTDLSVVAPGGGNGGDDDAADVDPSVSVDPEIAAPGEDVTIEGDDFAPGTTVDIEITDEDGDVIGTIEDVEVNDDGEFTQGWTVPEGTQPGDLTVTAEDEEGNSASAPLVIVGDGGSGDDDGTDEPSVSVDPDTAEPGDTVTVEGDDFTPGTTVDVEVTDEDGNVVGTIEDIEVDENGEFDVDWTLPEDLQPGELVVTATDEDGNSASAPLEVLGAGAGGDEDGVAVESDGDDDGATGSGVLATTGATVATFGLVALVLTLIGVGLYVASRQRRVTDHE